MEQKGSPDVRKDNRQVSTKNFLLNAYIFS